MKPIITIDDDHDDQDIFRRVLKEMKIKNEVISFHNGQEAFDFLSRKEMNPFLIFSDINMPLMNGFQLQEKIHNDEELRIKCIPFIFLTTGGFSRHILEAYAKHAQGFFIKPNTIAEWKVLMHTIFEYWDTSKLP
jgi:CheY-like chemotaxis protein